MNNEDEFLKRCRQRAGEQNKGGDEQRTVYQSPAYHRLLGHAEQLENELNDSKELARKWYKQSEVYKIERFPEELFDGYGVTKYITDNRDCVSMPYNVSDVLDAVVRMIRERLGK